MNSMKEEFEDIWGTAGFLKESEAMEKIYSWIEQQIKSACDKQKELCLDAWGDIEPKDKAEILKNFPYPEGVEK